MEFLGIRELRNFVAMEQSGYIISGMKKEILITKDLLFLPIF